MKTSIAVTNLAIKVRNCNIKLGFRFNWYDYIISYFFKTLFLVEGPSQMELKLSFTILRPIIPLVPYNNIKKITKNEYFFYIK